MIYLTYEIDSYEIRLYKLEEGKNIYLETFDDREDLLCYIEKNFDVAELLVK